MNVRKFIVFIFLVGVVANSFAQLPVIQLKDLNGKVVDTSKLHNDGKPFVISFFATWCKPCNRELKAIHEQYIDWQEETGMTLIAISMNKVKPLVDGEGWEYGVLLDPNSDFRRAVGVQMIPHVLIVDGKGKIVESRSGYTEGAEEHIIEKIRELIQKK